MSETTAIQYTPLLLKAFSAWIAYLGASHMVRGVTQYLPPNERAQISLETTSQMDSQYRFLGATLIGFSAALCWTSYDITERHLPLNILMTGLCLSGAGRLISGLTFGYKVQWTMNATVTELVVPPLVYWFGIRNYE
ncbi:hypothetical protein FIE12Z_13050 [Fusarium flagelliforme]|uniref:DUF4345 domain-containing protein n=1 Tax=Fusarium flagelliforme TaxID=2675880 RepID=A0A395M4D1_9HYPO|nr:hypothetical protein FIE12Z_13050 [Fusarium flagelliforme]